MKANFLPKFLIALTLLTLTTISQLIASETSDYKIRDFALGRKSWEEFNTSFVVQNTVSGSTGITSDNFKIEMIGEDGTVLRTIRDKYNFTIDDKNLGSGEKLVFKLTVVVKGDVLTAERVDYASQKSVVIDNDISLPIENHISIGNVKLACKLMRTKFNNPSKWENIGDFSDVAVSLFISNGNANDYVEVPLNKKSLDFDLAQFKYFDELKMKMERDLRKNNTATIKYYFQFVWDRNTYIVDGGSKSIDVKDEIEMAIVKSYSNDVQKLVMTNNYTTNNRSVSASAE